MAGLCYGIGAAAYFTHPYSSWEKGAVERHNGLARLAAPKGARLGALPFGAIEAAERAINALPRRILGYRAPEAPFEADWTGSMERQYSYRPPPRPARPAACSAGLAAHAWEAGGAKYAGRHAQAIDCAACMRYS
jgi:hypothetical protein